MTFYLYGFKSEITSEMDGSSEWGEGSWWVSYLDGFKSEIDACSERRRLCLQIEDRLRLI